jgi:hypothetical protein
MTTQEQKNLILNAMREIFPSILPSRLQEARQAVLTHMGMTLADFGYYPSGQPRFDNLCSQAVKALKATGEMTTQGWEWRWNGNVVCEAEAEAEAPVASQPTQTTMEMMMLEEDLFGGEIEVNTNTPSLYDLTCEETLIRLVATTPCFGKVVQSDPVCQGCPLLAQCCEAKGEAQQAKREAREARNEALEIASKEGYDLSKVKVPKSAKLHDTTEIEALADTSCVVSGEPILKGEVAYHIPSWGMVKKVIGDAYKAMNNI